MGKGNAAVKQWMSNSTRFADLFNGVVFQGEQVIRPKDLEITKGESDIIVSDKLRKSKDIHRYRDITMKWKGKGRLTILACENQANIHYAMPIRNMLYDSLAYTEQIKQLWDEHGTAVSLTNEEYLSKFRKQDSIIPVITLVFYYGTKKWDGNVDLYEMFALKKGDEEKIKKYIPNYTINLVEADNINEKCFQTDLQEIFGMLKCRNNKKDLLTYMRENGNYFQSVDEETYYAIHEFLHSERIMKKEVAIKSRGERVDMCKALEELYNDGVMDGKIDAAKNLLDILDENTIAEKVGLPLDIVKKLKEEK